MLDIMDGNKFILVASLYGYSGASQDPAIARKNDELLRIGGLRRASFVITPYYICTDANTNPQTCRAWREMLDNGLITDLTYEWNDGDKAMDQSLPSTNVAAAAAAAAGQRKYHSQFYKNGSECDLTGHFRASEVRFECDPSAGHDVIVSIEEPLSCEYVLTVATSRICDVEQLRPTPTEKPREIKCSPALTEAEYDKFLKYEKGEVTKRINHNCSVNFVRLEELFQYICGYKI